MRVDVEFMFRVSPVDEAEFVYGLDGERHLGHIELAAFLRERVLLDEQRHHVT